MPLEDMVECRCGRRFIRIMTPRDEVEDGVALCRCERTLGVWSGPLRYVFDPEVNEDES